MPETVDKPAEATSAELAEAQKKADALGQEEEDDPSTPFPTGVEDPPPDPGG